MSKESPYDETDEIVSASRFQQHGGTEVDETMVLNFQQDGSFEEIRGAVSRSSVMPVDYKPERRTAATTYAPPTPTKAPEPPPGPPSHYMPYTESPVSSATKVKETPWYQFWQPWVVIALVIIITASVTWLATSKGDQSKDAQVDAGYDASIAALEEDTDALQAKVQELTKTNEDQAAKLSTTESSLKTAEQNLADAQTANDALQQAQDKQAQDLNTTQEALTKAEADLEAAQSSLNDVKAERDKWESVALEMANTLNQAGLEAPTLPNQN